MSSQWSRRDAIKVIGLASVPLSLSAWAKNDNGEPIILPDDIFHHQLDKPITAITLGAGARGNVYGDYAVEFPNQLDIIGVAEPIAIRNDRFAKKHNIAEVNRFNTWEDVFKKPKFADAIIISTPDTLHYGPCIAALKMGYDVLLEKPISPSEQECRDIMELTKKTGRIVAVCHVLRYAPYFIKLKELIQSGAIGEVVSLQHLEPIEHVHMSHSYVRGNWHKSDESTPIILAKSCHDLDIIKWMLDKQSKKIQAFGDLKWFRSKNAPKGSTERCTDGCAAEKTCPYSALKVYHQKKQRTYVFDLPGEKEKQADAILNYLKTTNYGRCVYRMDNDQPDHYTTNILFDDNVTASFSMEAFTPWGGRRTRIMGSHGFIEGDMSQFTIHNFVTNDSKKFDAKTIEVANYKNEGHGGGDWRLVANWIQAVAQQNSGLLTSTIDNSIESHVMGFAAEKSRKEFSVVDIVM
jgi:predicted dehydrogenase